MKRNERVSEELGPFTGTIININRRKCKGTIRTTDGTILLLHLNRLPNNVYARPGMKVKCNATKHGTGDAMPIAKTISVHREDKKKGNRKERRRSRQVVHA